MEHVKQNKLNFRDVLDWTTALLLAGIIMVIANVVGYSAGILESLPGMGLLIVFSLAGLILKKLLPFNIPAVAYISIIAMVCASPLSPIAPIVVEQVGKVNLLATTTPILAYAGVVVGRDWPAFKKIGYKGVLVSLVVILGTFSFSAIIAEIFLRL